MRDRPPGGESRNGRDGDGAPTRGPGRGQDSRADRPGDPRHGRAIPGRTAGAAWAYPPRGASPALVAGLLHGGGLRRLEALSLRVKDLDFERREIRLRNGKGRKDRVTTLPVALVRPLRAHLDAVHARHERDLAVGLGEAPVPGALARKLTAASREWRWRWVFPASTRVRDTDTV